jgi:hypothetical protein
LTSELLNAVYVRRNPPLPIHRTSGGLVSIACSPGSLREVVLSLAFGLVASVVGSKDHDGINARKFMGDSLEQAAEFFEA